MNTPISESHADMQAQLARAAQDGQIVSVYANAADTTRFWGGYVLLVDDVYCLMAHITPGGLYDGYVLFPLENVWKLEEGGAYNAAIEKLYRLQAQAHAPVPAAAPSVLQTLLQFAQDNRLIVTLSVSDELNDDAAGYVLDAPDGLLKLQAIDQYGREDGVCFVRADSVSLIACDTDTEAAMRRLHTAQKEQA